MNLVWELGISRIFYDRLALRAAIGHDIANLCSWRQRHAVKSRLAWNAFLNTAATVAATSDEAFLFCLCHDREMRLNSAVPFALRFVQDLEL